MYFSINIIIMTYNILLFYILMTKRIYNIAVQISYNFQKITYRSHTDTVWPSKFHLSDFPFEGRIIVLTLTTLPLVSKTLLNFNLLNKRKHIKPEKYILG